MILFINSVCELFFTLLKYLISVLLNNRDFWSIFLSNLLSPIHHLLLIHLCFFNFRLKIVKILFHLSIILLFNSWVWSLMLKETRSHLLWKSSNLILLLLSFKISLFPMLSAILKCSFTHLSAHFEIVFSLFLYEWALNISLLNKLLLNQLIFLWQFWRKFLKFFLLRIFEFFKGLLSFLLSFSNSLFFCLNNLFKSRSCWDFDISMKSSDWLWTYLFMLHHFIHFDYVVDSMLLVKLVSKLDDFILFILTMSKWIECLLKKILFSQLKFLECKNSFLFQLSFFIQFSKHLVDIHSRTSWRRSRRDNLWRH